MFKTHCLEAHITRPMLTHTKITDKHSAFKSIAVLIHILLCY